MTELKKLILQEEEQNSSDHIIPVSISESQPKTSGITKLPHDLSKVHRYQGLSHLDKSNNAMPNIIDGKVLTDQAINLIPTDSYREKIPITIRS